MDPPCRRRSKNFRTNKNSKRVGGVADKLRGLGLVELESYGRIKIVKLTPKGYRVYEKILDTLHELGDAAKRPELEHGYMKQPEVGESNADIPSRFANISLAKGYRGKGKQ
ncbi:MAG: hypothetical protein QXY49_01920 [Thermofilaceae archaeon]